MKYTVIYYFDVWGNPDDGFEVNDVHNLGAVDLDIRDEDDDDRFTNKVLKALEKWFDSAKLRDKGFRIDNSVSSCERFEFVIPHEDGMDEPIMALVKEEDNGKKKEIPDSDDHS